MLSCTSRLSRSRSPGPSVIQTLSGSTAFRSKPRQLTNVNPNKTSHTICIISEFDLFGTRVSNPLLVATVVLRQLMRCHSIDVQDSSGFSPSTFPRRTTPPDAMLSLSLAE